MAEEGAGKLELLELKARLLDGIHDLMNDAIVFAKDLSEICSILSFLQEAFAFEKNIQGSLAFCKALQNKVNEFCASRSVKTEELGLMTKIMDLQKAQDVVSGILLEILGVTANPDLDKSFYQEFIIGIFKLQHSLQVTVAGTSRVLVKTISDILLAPINDETLSGDESRKIIREALEMVRDQYMSLEK